MTDAASVPADAPQPPVGAMEDAPAVRDRGTGDRGVPEDPATSGSASAPIGLDGAGRPWPPFAHGSEAEMARILDFYEVRWDYEPRTFPILWNLDGDVVESFSPDFYLPDLDLFLEMTTLKQRLVRKKNRKLRRLRELYPDVRIKLFYARDFRAMMLKYGRLALADSLSGTLGQVMPDRPREEDLGLERVIASVVDLAASLAESELAAALAGPESLAPTPGHVESPASTPAEPVGPDPRASTPLRRPPASRPDRAGTRHAPDGGGPRRPRGGQRVQPQPTLRPRLQPPAASRMRRTSRDDEDDRRSPGRHRRDPPDRGPDPGPGRRAGGPDQRRLRRPPADAGERPEGLPAVHGRPDALHLPAAPDRPHGGLARTAGPPPNRRAWCGS